MGIDNVELLFPPPRPEDDMRKGPDDDDGDTGWDNFGDGDGGPTD
jgi:hypothetical protein